MINFCQACNGDQQSPIDIETSQIKYNPKLKPFKLIGQMNTKWKMTKPTNQSN